MLMVFANAWHHGRLMQVNKHGEKEDFKGFGHGSNSRINGDNWRKYQFAHDSYKGTFKNDVPNISIKPPLFSLGPYIGSYASKPIESDLTSYENYDSESTDGSDDVDTTEDETEDSGDTESSDSLDLGTCSRKPESQESSRNNKYKSLGFSKNYQSVMVDASPYMNRYTEHALNENEGSGGHEILKENTKKPELNHKDKSTFSFAIKDSYPEDAKHYLDEVVIKGENLMNYPDAASRTTKLNQDSFRNKISNKKTMLRHARTSYQKISNM